MTREWPNLTLGEGEKYEYFGLQTLILNYGGLNIHRNGYIKRQTTLIDGLPRCSVYFVWYSVNAGRTFVS